MAIIDILIFFLYMAGMLAFGYYFLRRNEGADDYYAGGRDMGSLHTGLSVVATDVGGGFSIGLGGLGFAMGLSGSWMLFTGLLGAWLAAVFLIPKIKDNPKFKNFLTLPQVFGHYYGRWIALIAALITTIGYGLFTSSQILAGAKLASGTIGGLNVNLALYIMGAVAVLYTVMGGLKAVIYTDTIQWSILMIGLIFIGLPIAYFKVGGWEAIQGTLQPEMLQLSNVSWQQLTNWAFTIIPIWFVGMTLYQRIYACRDTKTAKKAWYLAGLFEYPVMAFMGVGLGVLARVAADQGMFEPLGAAGAAGMDSETGMPMLLRTVLPAGLLGIMLSAYFSAILSTADSCLMAASGSFTSDITGHFKEVNPDSSGFLRFSQVTTLGIGVLAILLATAWDQVLDLMLYSYAFMVSGLLVPLIGALYWKRSSKIAAFFAMIVGGFATFFLKVFRVEISENLSREALITKAQTLSPFTDKISGMNFSQMDKAALLEKLQTVTSEIAVIDIGIPDWQFALPWHLDANIYGITGSAVIFVILCIFFPKTQTP